MTALPRENREHDVSAEGYYPADEMFVVLLCTLYRQLELGGNGLRSEQAAGRAHTETHIKVRLGSSVHRDHCKPSNCVCRTTSLARAALFPPRGGKMSRLVSPPVSGVCTLRLQADVEKQIPLERQRIFPRAASPNVFALCSLSASARACVSACAAAPFCVRQPLPPPGVGVGVGVDGGGVILTNPRALPELRRARAS